MVQSNQAAMIPEAERLIKDHRPHSFTDYDEQYGYNEELAIIHAIQSAIISATTARDSHDKLESYPRWKFYDDVIAELKSRL